MTQHLMDRRIPRGAGSLDSGPVLVGATAALLGLAVTGMPVLVLWVLTATGHESAGDAAHLVGALWLLGHGGPLTRGRGAAPLSLTPLLLTLLNVLLVRCAAARAAAAVQPRTGSVPALACAGYLLVALPVALACAGKGVGLRAEPLPDLLAVALLGYTGAALGTWSGERSHALRPAGGWAHRCGAWVTAAERRLPPGCPAAVRGAVAAGLLTLLAGGAALFGMAVLLRMDTTDPTVRALTGGSVPAALGLLLTCLLLVPNAVLWAGAYALGPGFLLGTDTVVAPGRVQHGALPEFPLLALAPGTASGWQLLVLAVPVLAGAAAAGLLGRAAGWGGGRGAGAEASAGTDGAAADRAEPAQPWRPLATALAALATAPLVGALVALAGWLAGGAVGGGRMARLGPSFACGAVAAGWFAVLVLPGALAVRWWLLRRARPAGQAEWDLDDLDELDGLADLGPGLAGWTSAGSASGGPRLDGQRLGGPRLDGPRLDGPYLSGLGLDGPYLGALGLDDPDPDGPALGEVRPRPGLAVRWAALGRLGSGSWRPRSGRGRDQDSG
ncbi:cell division protein PerM [Kitasatospora kifunensis]|uniref:Integral membrane protein n=1 Tax=Kitasatospora kifunensis TaxID=58351 RepID=A0A7W7VWC4_KITKI|nr:DUF6350 family protein [Kitasatospora kifunensis]MBB4925291.1 hypothetical protein [Kitasatospora kifunensis]